MKTNGIFSRWLSVLCLSVALVLPQISVAEVVEEKPSAVAMTADLLLVRPALLAVTVVGTAVYLVSLPFALVGGNARDAGNTLVLGPAQATFQRCLGCTRPGYKEAIPNNDH